jgi:hypothetical protein
MRFREEYQDKSLGHHRRHRHKKAAQPDMIIPSHRINYFADAACYPP